MAPLLSRLLSNIGGGAVGGTRRRGGVALTGLTATGGVISDYTDPGPGAIYRAHIFTSSGTFTVSDPTVTSVEYLVVGGGGGASSQGGGGGAGGYRTNVPGQTSGGGASAESAYPVSPGAYSIVIGGGGAGATSETNSSKGGDSDFYPSPVSYPSPTFVRSFGGGKGQGAGGTVPAPTLAGGSGGGGSYMVVVNQHSLI